MSDAERLSHADIGAVVDSADGQEAGGGDDSDVMDGITTMPSYCVCCEENGTTNLLLTKIPYFRDVIIMAFSCPHCGYRSSEVQDAAVEDLGSKFELVVTSSDVSVILLIVS